jgi:hypothetical protein
MSTRHRGKLITEISAIFQTIGPSSHSWRSVSEIENNEDKERDDALLPNEAILLKA